MKAIINIILGFFSLLALNENLDALWLNVIGIGCFALLLVINPNATVFAKK